jgi:ornithine cyclodeaminase/alanine dehydrogenase-like protein (mu-crystallin family)
MAGDKVKFLSEDDVKKCIDMSSAIDAMADAFSQLSSGNAVSPQRLSIDLDKHNGGSLFMPVYMPSKNLVGLKTVHIHKKNAAKGMPVIHAVYSLFNAETGQTIAVMDGEYLTAVRTGAASGLATKLLSLESAKVLAVFGAGVQSRTQAEAVCVARNIDEIFVFDIDQEKSQKFAAEMSGKLSINVSPQTDLGLLKSADVICTATTTDNPLFDDTLLKPGVHINGVGSYTPQMCEIPPQTIKRSILVVDSAGACLVEAGDIIQPLESGMITKDHIHAEIGEIVLGTKSGRSSNDEITVFKSVGNAVQDVAAAAVIMENAGKLNVGSYFNL